MKTKSQLLEKFNDPDFVVRLQAGDDSAFRWLRDELFPWLIAFAVKKYRITEEEAKDLVQDLAVVLIDKIQTFDPSPRRFVAWVFQILKNRCIDELRKRRKFRFTSLESIPKNLAIRDAEYETPIKNLSALEKLPLEVRETILRLPDRYQQFIGLMLLEASESYIREILAIKTPSAFRSLKSRVLARLRAEIQKST
jgi:RNA polymerase sigma factor (sigma-70 family)